MRTLKRLWAVLIMVLIIVLGNCVNAFADSINVVSDGKDVTLGTEPIVSNGIAYVSLEDFAVNALGIKNITYGTSYNQVEILTNEFKAVNFDKAQKSIELYKIGNNTINKIILNEPYRFLTYGNNVLVSLDTIEACFDCTVRYNPEQQKIKANKNGYLFCVSNNFNSEEIFLNAGEKAYFNISGLDYNANLKYAVVDMANNTVLINYGVTFDAVSKCVTAVNSGDYGLIISYSDFDTPYAEHSGEKIPVDTGVYAVLIHVNGNPIPDYMKTSNFPDGTVQSEKTIPLYSADGRIRYTLESEVEAYKKVGWYENCPIVGKTVWINDLCLPYSDFPYDSEYMSKRTVWKLDTISGFNADNLEKINDNQYKIKEFYFWEDNKRVTINSDVLFSGKDYRINSYCIASWDNPKNVFKLTDDEWNGIQNGKIWVGMSKTAFQLLGYTMPDAVNSRNTIYGVYEEYTYKFNYLWDTYYFLNGYLTEFNINY